MFWSKDCATNNCYGVPLYRLLETGTETKNGSSPPFIRMAGTSTYQRFQLTANNGVYYIDTTKTLEEQRNTGSFSPSGLGSGFNVFESGETYYVFFVFAKDTTKQEYQLFVGPGFKSPEPTNDEVFLTRMSLTDLTPTKQDEAAWKSSGWSKTYNPDTGILTVDVKMTNFKDALSPTHFSTSGLCKPNTFCNVRDNKCAFVGTLTDYPVQKTDKDFAPGAGQVCGTWAVKDLDCPIGGCFGFGVKFPTGFDAATKPAPPTKGTCFPKDNDWTTPGFVITKNAGSQCTYTSVASGDFCSK